ncbi:MAG: alpha,alpha-trehalose-phosphate synthase (UDP-forming) [Candidatus Rokuibacteriota bacterium]
MKFTLRLVGTIWLSAMLVVAAFAWLQIRDERARLTADLERRAILLGEGLKEAVEPVVVRGAPAVERILKRFGTSRRGVAVYDRLGGLVVATPDVAPILPASLAEVTEAIAGGAPTQGLRPLGGRDSFVYATPLMRDERPVGALAVILDASHLRREELEAWKQQALRFLVLALVTSLIAIAVVRSTLTQPLARMSAWTRALRSGRPVAPPSVPDARLFGSLADEVSSLARSLQRARAAAAEEAALRLAGESVWTEERLKQFFAARVGSSSLVVVSNREPVSHVFKGGRIHARQPASGLVTAMEPVMRACGGIWVAHASGDADAKTADAHGRIALPEDDPRYTLRRVWLDKEEEAGYYYGFSNEGLWPLCHIVHTRPEFRPSDWAHYVAVNEKFADAVLQEIRDAQAPMVLIQDYHFAILPALIKAARPDARVAIFWHIPWPNFEAFGICPWRRELLAGMLGADLIGFHTQYYCNNFLESVEREVEARVDWEAFNVVRGEHATLVKPFPISVAPEFVDEPPATSRADLLARLGTSAEFLGVGVERVDYTKGLPERFRALQRFFERRPEYKGRVVFVQLGAPSRLKIPRYAALEAEVEATISEINGALGTRTWRPILYLKGHHERTDIWPFYRHADFCMVTSLHDGMNLVAKEFVSVRDDEDGVLILSRFTGAARELVDALLVNPYDVDETADAIRAAVEMDREDRRGRMARMRFAVREHNIYRWAGFLLNELTRIPTESPGVKAS